MLKRRCIWIKCDSYQCITSRRTAFRCLFILKIYIENQVNSFVFPLHCKQKIHSNGIKFQIKFVPISQYKIAIKSKINLFHKQMLSIHLKVQKLTERKINCVPKRKRKPNFVLASKSIMIRTQSVFAYDIENVYFHFEWSNLSCCDLMKFLLKYQ